MLLMAFASGCGAAGSAVPRQESSDSVEGSPGERGTNAKSDGRETSAGDEARVDDSSESNPAGSSGRGELEEAPEKSSTQPPAMAPTDHGTDGGGLPEAEANDGVGILSILASAMNSLAIMFLAGVMATGLLIAFVLMWLRKRRNMSGNVMAQQRPDEATTTSLLHGHSVTEPHPFGPVKPQASANAAAEWASAVDVGAQFAKMNAEMESLRGRFEELEVRVSALFRHDEAPVEAQAKLVTSNGSRVEEFYLGQSEATSDRQSALLPTEASTLDVRQRLFSFPSRASECLQLLRESGAKVILAKKGLAPKTLAQVAAGTSAAFVLVEADTATGRFLALPNRPRFAESMDYDASYKEYYDCASPSSGNLIVESVAVVCQSGSEWMLESRGVLLVEQ